MEHHDEVLKINPSFRLMVLPLTDAEYVALENEILTLGNLKPVQCWYGFIISEFERVEISQKYGIPYDMVKINFRTEIEIVMQICERELQERILPADMRRYLIGKLYDAEKIIAAHRAAGTNKYKEKQHRKSSHGKQPVDVRPTYIRERLGNQYHLNPVTVSRYALYAEGIDRIFHDDPQKAEQILHGKVKLSVDTVCGYAVQKENIDNVGCDIEEEIIHSSLGVSSAGPSVKDMPEFDPDAEINSLSLTIPSWTRSLKRIRSTAKIPLTTENGRQKLRKELRRLISEANRIDSVLEVK